jgi:serine/threonine-protein kinase
MTCPNCNKPLAQGARFCHSCGYSISADTLSSSEKPTLQINAFDTANGAKTSDSLIDQTLDSKYRIEARLGQGGMGAVYRARRIHIGDDVAVKVLHHSFVKDAQALERFRREARAAAMLRHPNVVVIHDYGETGSPDAPAFIVMELVSGVSLRDLLDRQGKLPVERAAQLMRSVCAGVAAAHRNNIVHRDLKPDNIIVVPPHSDAEQETAKVLDFGIAKLRDAAGGQGLTQTGVVIGTPYYMSPEQCRAEPLDSRSDVYSLGAVLYEMLSGSPPFEAATATGVVAKHLTDPPPRLPSALGVSQAVEAVIIRALSKEPAQRQADAAEFAGELARAVSESATSPLHRAETARESAPPPATRQAGLGEIGLGAAGQPAYGQASYQQRAVPQAPQAKRSRTGLVVGVSVAAVVLLIGIGSAAWLLSNRETASQGGASNQNSSSSPAQSQLPALAATNVNQAAPSRAPVVAPNQNTANQNTAPPPPSATQPASPAPLPLPPPPVAGGSPATAGPVTGGRNEEAVFAGAENKILANQRLAESDLQGLPLLRLRMLRNTVYARHGRPFRVAPIRLYFQSRSWYTPRPGYRDSDLTPIDRMNIRTIQAAENQAK